ncbi:hypothetical protein V144x_22120 [Gimesia aquarii]|uniref:Uncharacterized protein n=1 Tax=Gimesia aquarii TaxID=2527964 RepID=A0A517VUS1_9PLAN|nr:hypothetical protein V144x_22120 [Gimesia aquarii]
MGRVSSTLLCRVKYRGIPLKYHTPILWFSVDGLHLMYVSAKLPKRTVAPFPLYAGAVEVSPILLPVGEAI